MSYDYELTTGITFNRVSCLCDLEFSIVEKGTITATVKTDTIRHPDGYFSYDENYITDEELDELPEFEIDSIRIYQEGTNIDLEIDKEDLDGFFILHPDIQLQLERAVEEYCKEDLFDDAVSAGDDSHAYNFRY